MLTVDLGTSGPKAAVVDERARVVGSARGRVMTQFGDDRSAEQDPEAVWTATLECATGALASSGVSPGSVAAVAVSSQYSSVIPVGEDGTAVGAMHVWMDQRGTPKKLKRLAGYPRRADSPAALVRWLRVHGLAPIDAGMSLNHMRWIRYGDPECYERTAVFLEPVDYLVMRLTGRATANRCSAQMMMLTDNRAGAPDAWDGGLVEQSLIDPEKLPEIVPVGSVVGTLLPTVAEALGLPAATPVLAGINDTQAGAIAAGACHRDHAGLAIGTTSVIAARVPKKKTNPLRSLFTVPSPLGHGHLLSGENGVAGVAVDHFLDQVVYPDDPFATSAAGGDRYEAFNEAAAAASASSRVLFLPWLQGSLAPDADGRMRGGFLNLGLGTTRNDLARAVLEGVALNLRWLQGPAEKFADRTFGHFVFYGGGAASDVWSQIMANVLRAPVHQLAAPGFANSVGTALYAFDQLGMADAGDLISLVDVRQVYQPDRATFGRYDQLYGALVESHKRFKPIVHRLNRRR